MDESEYILVVAMRKNVLGDFWEMGVSQMDCFSSS